MLQHNVLSCTLKRELYSETSMILFICDPSPQHIGAEHKEKNDVPNIFFNMVHCDGRQEEKAHCLTTVMNFGVK